MTAVLPDLEATIIAWAVARDDVHGVVNIGSRARSVHPADAWSDLDLIMFTTIPEAYVASADWLDEWGEVWAPSLSRTGAGLAEWLVLFAGGIKVDVVLAQANGSLADLLVAFPHQDVLRRGMRVLVDKTASRGQPMPGFASAPQLPPTEHVFQNAVFGFLVAADKTARLLSRGELWRAKMLCDGDLKLRLLTFLEWQAQAAHSFNADTWYEGRFLDEWADPMTLAGLPAAFAIYSQADLWRALLVTLALFRRLAVEIAERWGLVYPRRSDEQVTAGLHMLREQHKV